MKTLGKPKRIMYVGMHVVRVLACGGMNAPSRPTGGTEACESKVGTNESTTLITEGARTKISH